MTDRELLEKAAKAAGLVGEWGEDIPDCCNCSDLFFVDEYPWNPLDDDAAALQLAVKLQIDIAFVTHHAPGLGVVVFADGNWSEFLEPDHFAATRRAIVRAAAEMVAA